MGEVLYGDAVAFVDDVGAYEVYLGFGIKGFLDFWGDDTGFDDDFSIHEEFGKDEGAGVAAKGHRTSIAVAEEDFRLAGVFVRLGRKSERH